MTAVDKLADLVRERGNLTFVFSLLKPLTREDLGPDLLKELEAYFTAKDTGLARGVDVSNRPPKEWFTYTPRTYLDWFARSLKPDRMAELVRGCRGKVVIPAESVIESVGTVQDTSSILRLKKEPSWAQQCLEHLGVPGTAQFINLKLLSSFYHHVHAPCAGKLTQIREVSSTHPLFGRATLNMATIEGEVRCWLLIVGEAVVQDFAFAVEEGADLQAGDDLGHFTWGSQVVVILDGVGNVNLTPRKYYFVGEPVTG
jgi:phosphatidylserine decarboxylase